MLNTKKILLVLSASTALGDGYSVFTPNCTKPEQSYNLVKSPSGRGTLNIFWSCIATIIACTWTVLHLNVPEKRSDRDSGWRGDIKWNMKGFWTKIKWMLVTMLAPELALTLAAANFMNAREQRDRLAEFAEKDGVEWTVTTHISQVWVGSLSNLTLVQRSLAGRSSTQHCQLEITKIMPRSRY
jgi:hypothetical protein